MGKYEFVPSRGESSDPIIRRKDGGEGVIDFLLMGREEDIIYFNQRKHRTYHSFFRISPFGNFVQSRMAGLPSDDRLRAYSDEDLLRVSQVTEMPLDELREVRDIERGLENLHKPRPAPKLEDVFFRRIFQRREDPVQLKAPVQ